MPIVFAAIAPHGGIAVEEACAPEELKVAEVTRAGMQELGRLFDEARPEVAVVVTPHNVHISDAFGVIVAARVAGSLSGAQHVKLDLQTDGTLAWGILGCMNLMQLPSAGVSFGSNDPGTAVAPMDWGVLIPLWFMGGRSKPPVDIVVVTPARDLPAEAHTKAGEAIHAAAERSSRRVALIASADHGHAHLQDGPYGYHPAAKEYDTLVKDIVGKDELHRLRDISYDLVDHAKADSWWQMLVLHGAVDGFRGRLVSYEAPTYFGMLTAAYSPA